MIWWIIGTAIVSANLGLVAGALMATASRSDDPMEADWVDSTHGSFVPLGDL